MVTWVRLARTFLPAVTQDTSIGYAGQLVGATRRSRRKTVRTGNALAGSVIRGCLGTNR